MQPDSTLSILSRNKLLDKWSDGSLLPGSINEAMNADYPYVLTDGITIYYASDGPGSMEDMIFSSPVTIRIPTPI